MSKSDMPHHKIKSSDIRGVGKADCPVRKHHVMHGEQAPCSGCAATRMPQLRHHLLQSPHSSLPLFLKWCARCTTTVVDRASWVDGLHEAGTCERRVAPRESIVTTWVQLYLALYPTATRVPNPYTNERGWLPDAIVSFIRSPHTNLSTGQNTSNHNLLNSPSSNTQEASTLVTNVDNFMPSPAHSESTGSNTPDSRSIPLSQEIIDLISAGNDNRQTVEKVQDYLRSQLNIMSVEVYAVIDGYLGTHCDVGRVERDSAYGSMVARSVQSHSQDTDDSRSMAEIDPWSHYNTRLDHASEKAMPTPGEFQNRPFLIRPAESPSPLSLQPFENPSLETLVYESPSEIETEDRGNDGVHSCLPSQQPRGDLIPIVEVYMNAARARWDLSTYTCLWLNFIQRWDRIIEELGRQGSTMARDAFARVLQSIRARVQLDIDDPPSFAEYQEQHSHITHGNQTETTASSKKRARNEGPSRSSEKGKKRVKAASGSEADNRNQLLVDDDDPIDEVKFPEFHCPVRMYCLKNNMHPICEIWTGDQVAQLYHRHLNPRRANGHGGLIVFFKRCKNCREFVVDQNLWERHQRSGCKLQDRPKRRKRAEVDKEGDDVLLAVWSRIYLTFFPDEHDVPNPYVGQTGNIPRHLTELFRRQVTATLPPLEASSFLGDQHEEAVVPLLPGTTINNIALHAANDVIWNDFINPLALTLDTTSPRSILRHESTSHNANLGPFFAGSSIMTNRFDFEARLGQASEATLDALHDASICLNPAAFKVRAAQFLAQLLARIEALQNPQGPAGTLPMESTAMLSDLYGPNLRSSYSHEQAAALNSSTLPSTQATSTQGPSTNLTSLDDTEGTEPNSPPPQTAALPGSSHYPLQDMGAMDKELDQLARRDTLYATTSVPDALSDMEFDFDAALRGYESMDGM